MDRVWVAGSLEDMGQIYHGLSLKSKSYVLRREIKQ
ncbi:uncharacterized protein An18g04720 [Aspergillus niger]|uniref:Contig An18c0160, genomic contig n=2 Tax=Aspergillus niger TaxID=5061 RepID=A2RAX8_ASPNC|nr:uncharacterized protein An18g04720 [Aspergillus niger]CAK43274.1 unnamed protein product [Aspergillus niger]